MLQQCSNCKHWKPKFQRENKIPDVARCLRLSMTMPAEGVIVNMEGIYDEIGWEGEESYDTGKDFGCIYFEDK